jgi:hypothetical protein
VTLHWTIPQFPNTTGYSLFLNGSHGACTQANGCVGSATSSRYTFSGTDCGTTDTLGVEAHNASGGTGPLWTTHYATPPCAHDGPSNTSSPVLGWNLGESKDTDVVGQTVNVTAGGWSGAPTSVAYQWRDCDSSGTSCTNVEGETEPIYTLHALDVGHYIQAQVTATNHSGSTTVTSRLTGPITATGSATYYVADNGSDSNNGTSQATPWQHAPGMTGCAANCAGYAFHPGDQIILKGGDTWDYTGAKGVQGLPWVWNDDGSWNGTSRDRLYVGVDRSWYDGSAWTRPKLDGDNPLSTGSPERCTESLASAGRALDNKGSYTTFDGLEFRGFCLTNSATQSDVTVMDYGTSYSKFLNFYFHGWTVAKGSPQFGQNIAMINGATSGPTYPNNNNELGYDIWDGSDSTTQSGTALYGDCYDINHSYVRYYTNISCDNAHIINDNVFEYANEDDSNGADHGNTFEANSEAHSNNYFFNNVVRHIGTISPIGVNWWIAPYATDYMYNNVMYDVNAGNNYLDCANCNGKANLLNNTFVNAGGNDIAHDEWGLVANNNFIIASGSGTFSQPPATETTNYQSTTTDEGASGAGYTTSNHYAPTRAEHPTRAYGTNESRLCSSLPAYCSDTTLGVGLNTSGGTDTLTYPSRVAEPRATSGPWDAGAFDYPRPSSRSRS